MKLIKYIYAVCNPILEPNCVSNSAVESEIANNPITYTNNVIQTIITLFLIVGSIYFIWHVVMSAYHMISSQGDPKKWEEAQKSLIYSIIGVVVIFSIFLILRLIGMVFGIPSLSTLQIKWPSITP